MAMRLRTLLGDHPCTAALKNGSIKSDLVEFEFVEYKPTNKGFKPMVREGAFDVSELAIVTYLMAKNYDKPMVLLPNVVMARFQHGHAFYNAKRGMLTPADLGGKRVGIRSFTTTTGAWLRGILANDYGVDLNAIDWVTFEDAHVAEFTDTARRAPAGKQIVQMLLDVGAHLHQQRAHRVGRRVEPLTCAVGVQRSDEVDHVVGQPCRLQAVHLVHAPGEAEQQRRDEAADAVPPGDALRGHRGHHLRRHAELALRDHQDQHLRDVLEDHRVRPRGVVDGEVTG